MWRNLTLSFLLLGWLIVVSDSSKILAVVPTPGISHFIFAKRFLSSLTDVGHEVTLVSPYENEEVQNYTFVYIPELGDFSAEYISAIMNVTQYSETRRFNIYDLWKMLVTFYDVPTICTEKVFQNEKFQKILHEKFDLVMIEMIHYEALLGLGFHFDCPVVVFSTLGPTIATHDITGNPKAFDYVSDFLFPFTDHMTFFRHMIHSIIITVIEILKKTYYYPKQDEVLHKYLPNTPDIYTVLHNVSLTFLNFHESFSDVRPLMPNTISVGGIHIPKLKKLPQNLQEYLDSASDGFIFISFGTITKNEHVTYDIESSLMKPLGKLKQKIILKWDDEITTKSPKNIKIGKWFPQVEILAHPNIKLFVTHGGIGSVTEALWFGVPMLGIPTFCDQYYNVNRITNLECGLGLLHKDINESSFTNVVNELLNNPKYSKNIKKRSELLRDQAMSPQEKVRYWTEYVIKHRGAFHLRPPVFDLYWFQSPSFSVTATILLVFMVLIGIIYLIFSCLKKLILLPFKKLELSKEVNQKKKNK